MFGLTMTNPQMIELIDDVVGELTAHPERHTTGAYIRDLAGHDNSDRWMTGLLPDQCVSAACAVGHIAISARKLGHYVKRYFGEIEDSTLAQIVNDLIAKRYPELDYLSQVNDIRGLAAVLELLGAAREQIVATMEASRTES